MNSARQQASVVVVGAGPTGLWLARELAVAGIEVRVLEKNVERAPFVRAMGIQARTLEILEMRGVLERFLEQGRRFPYANVAGLYPWLSLEGMDTTCPYALLLRQSLVEELLEKSLTELGVEVEHGRQLASVEPRDGHVLLRLADGAVIEATYAVGCDGAHSTVRKQARIGFPGFDSTMTYLLADVAVQALPPGLDGDIGFAWYGHGHGGWVGGGKMPGGQYRLMIADARSAAVPQHHPVSIEEFRATLTRITGSDLGVHSPSWLSRVGNSSRLAERYRAGRVFLAGDAAHVHSPFGGQGLNTGIQDATNLGWKLAAVLRGDAAEDLLDTYHAERHPIGEAVIANTMAQTSMVFDFTPAGARHRELFSQLLELPQANRYLAGQITALDYAYPPGDPSAHPLIGTRVPDLTLDSPLTDRLFPLLHDTNHVLLNLTDSPVKLPAPGPVRTVPARLTAPRQHWRPYLDAVLIRPDGYIAAVSASSEPTT